MTTIVTTDQKELFVPGSYWKLKKSINGYAAKNGRVLATQACATRCFEILKRSRKQSLVSQVYLETVNVRLLEDGYQCWFKVQDLLVEGIDLDAFKPQLLSNKEIRLRLKEVLASIEQASNRPNRYLWGGTLGPNFDCSGLVQWAFASHGIWLPRDAYQQENFCKPVPINHENFKDLIPGDLIFFGTDSRCTHVAIYKGNGHYWHSSGNENGRNGIGLDCLYHSDMSRLACHYRSMLRGAGRVDCCYDGSTLS